MDAKSKASFVANFDGLEVDGKFYKTGQPIEPGVDAGTIQYLTNIGQISGVDGDDSSTGALGTSGPGLPAQALPDPDTMTRPQLVAEMASMLQRSTSVSDDDLRDRIRAGRENEADDGDQGDEGEGEDDAPETVAALTTRIADISDLGELGRIREDEVAGANRGGAIRAIDKRVSALNTRDA